MVNGLNKGRASSYLPLDVYFAEGAGTKLFENRSAFFHSYAGGSFRSFGIHEVQRLVVSQKLTALLVVFEPKLLSQKAECNGHIPSVC